MLIKSGITVLFGNDKVKDSGNPPALTTMQQENKVTFTQLDGGALVEKLSVIMAAE